MVGLSSAVGLKTCMASGSVSMAERTVWRDSVAIELGEPGGEPLEGSDGGMVYPSLWGIDCGMDCSDATERLREGTRGSEAFKILALTRASVPGDKMRLSDLGVSTASLCLNILDGRVGGLDDDPLEI